MFDFVKAATKDGLILNGLFASGEKNKPVIIFIHGYSQDFFQNPFIYSIAKKLANQGIGFLSIQTRGTGTHLRTFTTSKKARDTGAKFELLEESYLDLDAWISLLKYLGYQEIILMGHSLGSIKAVRYLFEGSYIESITKLILLSPYDKNFLIKDFTKGKVSDYLKLSKEKIKKGKAKDEIPPHFDAVPSTYGTYVSFYDPGQLSDMFSFHLQGYDFPILKKINIPTLMLVGKDDPYFNPSNSDHPQQALDILKSNIANFHGELIDVTKHRFLGKEDLIAEKILGFVK